MNGNTKGVLAVIILLIVVAGFFVWQKAPRGETEETKSGDTSQTSASVIPPPVYSSGISPDHIVRPLYLEAGAKGELTAAQQSSIQEFKQKILERAASGVPLSVGEKSVMSISISTTTKPAIGSSIVADQNLYRFSPEELRLIEQALAK